MWKDLLESPWHLTLYTWAKGGNRAAKIVHAVLFAAKADGAIGLYTVAKWMRNSGSKRNDVMNMTIR